MNHAPWRMVLAFSLAGGLLGCQPGTDERRNLVLTGSREMTPLLRDIAKQFETNHPGVRVDVQARTSERGILDTRNGLADIGMASRNLKAEEAGLHVVSLGKDGIASIVNKANPVHSLTDEQLVSLWTRNTATWRQVGGSDRAVMLVGQIEGRSAREVFLDRFGMRQSKLIPDQVAGSSSHAIQAVAGLPTALGFASIGGVELAAKAGQPVRTLPLGGVEATSANVENGTYTLVRPLLLLTRYAPEGLVAEFLEFASAPQMHGQIRQHGFVPSVP
jgi:phosphate transport system substrate-binding protein